MHTAIHHSVQDHVRNIAPVIAPIAVMDALHDVTTGTPLDQPDRFDALYRDLMDLLDGFHPQATIDECLMVVGHPMNQIAGREERRDAMTRFFEMLIPTHLTVSEILTGLETRA
ncbi:hypothetical protein D3W54_01220 [Komagataeibacter medellinensis]|uniref:Uncharacterized protein n=1 Tax=Komagataeibacter medellinensis TaxID=1177712 RepID=A0ABQ6VXA0_9PROT|nr:hypothetical protein [Komagataeibacter medellinensis]KAB8123068.1 hypothetical protein D3W54_01220 [Komagataeibacter medellinensis]